LHLGLQSKEKELAKEKLFTDFISEIKHDARALFILGDLFDYWFEYRRVIQKGFFRTFTALKELTDLGAEVHYLIGNHDFLHRDFFEKELNVKVYQSDIIETINDKRFFMGHGDGLVKNDIGYLILKKVLRNKFIQGLYSIIHPDLGIAIASGTSKKSREYTKSKNYGEIDGVFEVAKLKIDEGFDYVLFGHTHERTEKQYKHGHYINLGTWLQKPCFGKFDGEKFSIIDL